MLYCMQLNKDESQEDVAVDEIQERFQAMSLGGGSGADLVLLFKILSSIKCQV